MVMTYCTIREREEEDVEEEEGAGGGGRRQVSKMTAHAGLSSLQELSQIKRLIRVISAPEIKHRR